MCTRPSCCSARRLQRGVLLIPLPACLPACSQQAWSGEEDRHLQRLVQEHGQRQVRPPLPLQPPLLFRLLLLLCCLELALAAVPLNPHPLPAGGG